MSPLKQWLNKSTTETTQENEYKPKEKTLLIKKTVFPNWSKKHPDGFPLLSPNGTGVWYGLIEGVKRQNA